MHDSPHRTPAPSSNGGPVLLVEDVQAMRLYLRVALERARISVIEAATLHDARRALRRVPALSEVILDLQLPDGDGLDLLPELSPDARVVALTADDSAETALRCRAAGCSAWVYKGDVTGCIELVLQALGHRDCKASTTAAPDTELSRQYLAYLTEANRELQQAYAHCDLSNMRRQVHRLRGTAAHFGYPEIGMSARVFGTALDAGSPEQLATTFDQLSEHLLQAVSARRRWPESAAPNSRLRMLRNKTGNPAEDQ